MRDATFALGVADELCPQQVEFRVNGVKTDYAMKLGEGGEAFFVFETSGSIPVDMQTSPLVSPAGSPRSEAMVSDAASLQEPDYLNIDDTGGGVKKDVPMQRVQSDFGAWKQPMSMSDEHPANS